MKGGHGSSGPPPDPHALRRDRDDRDWTTLPLAGREGEPPPWPLLRPIKRELELWEREWRRPQAVMWERNGQEIEVALYVRSTVAAEKREAPAAARTLVRQQQDALGVTLPGLARNRWRIGTPPAPAGDTSPGVARSSFRIVPGGAAGDDEPSESRPDHQERTALRRRQSRRASDDQAS